MSSSMELRFKCANNFKCPGAHKTFSFLTVLEHLVSIHLNKEERNLLYDYVCSCGAGFVCRPLAISHMISVKDRKGHKLSRNNNFDPDDTNRPELVEVCRKLTKDLIKNDVRLNDSIMERLKEEAREAVGMENEEKGKKNDMSTMTDEESIKEPVVGTIPQAEPSGDQETMDVEEKDDAAEPSFNSTEISYPSSAEPISPTRSFASISVTPSPPSLAGIVSSVPLSQGAPPPLAAPMRFRRTDDSSEVPLSPEESMEKPQKVRKPDEQRVFRILSHFMDQSHNLFEDVEEMAVKMYRGLSHCNNIHYETLAGVAVVRAGHSRGFHIPHKEMRYFVNVTVKQYDRVKTLLSNLFPFDSLETLRPHRESEASCAPTNLTNEESAEVLSPHQLRISKILSHFVKVTRKSFVEIQKKALELFNGVSNDVTDHEALAGAAIVRAAMMFRDHVKHSEMISYLKLDWKDYCKAKKAIIEYEKNPRSQPRASSLSVHLNYGAPLTNGLPFYPLYRPELHCDTPSPIMSPTYPPSMERSVSSPVKVRTADEQRVVDILSHFMDQSHNLFEDIEKKALELFNGVSDHFTDHDALAGVAVVRAAAIFGISIMDQDMLAFVDVPGTMYRKARITMYELFPHEFEAPSSRLHKTESAGSRQSSYDVPTTRGLNPAEAEPHFHQRHQNHRDVTSPIMSPTYPPSRERSVSSPVKVRTPDEQRVYDILNHFMDQSHNLFEDVEKKALELFNGVSNHFTDHEALAGVVIVRAATIFGIPIKDKEMLSFVNVPLKVYRKARSIMYELFPFENEDPSTLRHKTESAASRQSSCDVPRTRGLRLVEAEPRLQQGHLHRHDCDETSPISSPTYPPSRERSISPPVQELPRPHRPQAPSSTAFPVRGPLHPLKRFAPY